MDTPTLTDDQRRAAQAASLAVRQERARVKATIATSARPVETLLRYWYAPDIRGMKVYDLLRALPGTGTNRARNMMELAGIPLGNTVRACGPLQTERLFSLL